MGRSKKRKKRVSKNRTIVLTLLSLAVIITLSYVFSLNFVEVYNIYTEKKALSKKVVELNEEEEKLKDQVDKLKDPEYIARYAREKFLYSKDGEFIIKMP